MTEEQPNIVLDSNSTENTQEQFKQNEIANAIKEVQASKVVVENNTTKVQLPSNGLINPNITEVTLRRMTVKESKTLYSSNDPDYLATLVTGCIVEPIGITTRDLHPNDIIYLSFILRYISSPRLVKQRAVCTNPRCRRQFEHDVKIDQLSCKYATPDKYDYQTILPDNKDRIKFKILSEFDITNCEKISTRRAKQEGLDDASWYTLISKVAYMITDINDEPQDSMDKKIDYLESLSAYDFEYINKAYNDITSTFGLQRNFYTECPHCKEDVEVEAYIAPDFFQLV